MDRFIVVLKIDVEDQTTKKDVIADLVPLMLENREILLVERLKEE